MFQGWKKCAVQSSGTSRFSLWASSFSFSLAQWARDQASCLSTTSLKEQTMTCPGQANFEKLLVLRASWNSKFFSSPVFVMDFIFNYSFTK